MSDVDPDVQKSCSCTIYFCSLYCSVFDMLSGDWHIYKNVIKRSRSSWECPRKSSLYGVWKTAAAGYNGLNTQTMVHFRANVSCLHRRESGLNTDTDSAHTPHISRAEILTHIEAVFTALSSSFWIGLDKQSTDRHFLCEYSDERVRFRVNSWALPETGKAIKSPHLIARGNQNHIS